MIFATARYENMEEFVGVIDKENNRIINLSRLQERWGSLEKLPNRLQECIELGDKFTEIVSRILEMASENGELDHYSFLISEVQLLAPIPKPEKNIFCIGKNYRDHAIEMGGEQDIPTELIVFTKAPTTVIGHGEGIPSHDDLTTELDYEGELAVVIGKRGYKIKQEEAHNYIFGYTILNDITARDLQSRHKQFFLGKSLDGSCPVGPWIVHKSIIDNPNALKIETKINGEIRQQASTEQLIFPIEEIIEILSRGMTLEPGDIIATGTPAGVGKGFKPPKFLTKGDVVEITVENIGTLKNQVIEG